MTTRCAVLGSPIGHSLSPVLHRAAYAELGLDDWTYDGVVVDAAGLAGFLDGLDGSWRGLSLTMPLKRVVIPMVDSLDTWTRLSGVANTVLLGDERRLGFNTDIPGAMAALVERTSAPLESAVVLGGGATATSALLALVELGCTNARLLVRDPSRAEETVAVVAAHPSQPQVSVAPLGEVEADPGRRRRLDDSGRCADSRAARCLRRHPGGLRRRLRPVAHPVRPRSPGLGS